jgi:hypothetical protein
MQQGKRKALNKKNEAGALTDLLAIVFGGELASYSDHPWGYSSVGHW